MKTYSRKIKKEEVETLDFSNICRLCLTKNEDMYLIYQESLYLPMRIKACLDLEVDPYDGLPNYICEDCLGQIEKAYSFREVCLRSDETLRHALLIKNNNKSSQEEEKDENEPGSIETATASVSLFLLPVIKEEFVVLEEQNKNKENNHPTTQENENLLRPFQCLKCPKRFERRLDLRRHESVHNPLKGINCEFCEKWLPSKHSYERHKRSHTGVKPYECQFCGKTFSQSTVLQRHFLTHTGQKPFKCEQCNKAFTQKANLKAHIRKYHSGDEEKDTLYSCSICIKSFCHSSGLSRHLLRHTGKTYECPICKKPYTDQSSLKRHIKRHDDPPEQKTNNKEGETIETVEITGTIDFKNITEIQTDSL